MIQAQQGQQALTLVQQAVGQLQGMFKRLAAKMEQDVGVIRQAIEKLAGSAHMTQREVRALQVELATLKTEMSALRLAKGRVAFTQPLATEAKTEPVKPATVDGREVKAEILPPVMTESADEDDAFFSGED